MKAVVAAFNQEKALVGAFSVIVETGCGTDGSFYSTSLRVSVVSRVGRVVDTVGTMTVITGQCAMVITPRQLSAFPNVNTQTHTVNIGPVITRP